jgi:copper(I)-binding protein
MLRYMLFAAVLLLSPDTVRARDFTIGPIRIEQPWTRVTPKGASVASGYLKITNTGSTSDRLTGGSFANADRLEVHEMKMEGGVMKMRQLKSGIEIKPGQTIELKPGSYHLMFLPLRRPVTQDEPIKGTLVFEKAGSVEVEYSVAPVGGMPAMH